MRVTTLALGVCLLPACGSPPPACPPQPPPQPAVGGPATPATTPQARPAPAPAAHTIQPRFVQAAARYAAVQRAKIRADAAGAVTKLSLYHNDASQVPEQARSMALKAFPGAEIVSYELEHYADHGWVIEVEVKTEEGKHCELAVVESGSLLYEECAVSPADLPPTVTKTIETTLPGAQILEAERKKGPTKDEIHVEVKAGDLEHYFHFKATGELIRHLLKIPATLEVPVQ